VEVTLLKRIARLDPKESGTIPRWGGGRLAQSELAGVPTDGHSPEWSGNQSQETIMPTNKKSTKKMSADNLVKTSEKGEIELLEEELNKVTGGGDTATTIGSATGGAGAGKIKFNEF
jgi:hypothetical protein